VVISAARVVETMLVAFEAAGQSSTGENLDFLTWVRRRGSVQAHLLEEDHMTPAESTMMIRGKSDTPARIEIQEVERPTVQAKQAIGANSGSSPPSRS
jgi:hypothetical protein